MEEKHAKFSPSKLPRIVRCPGSVEAEKAHVQKEGIYAAEGTALHELTELHLRARTYNVTETLVGQINYNITKEHKEAVQEVLDWVAALHMKHADAKTKVNLIEEKVSLKNYEPLYDCPELKDVYGTADYIFLADATLYIIDWKYGKGVEVYPDSEQAYAYAAGALQHQQIIVEKVTKVILVIGQPRLYSGEHFKTLELSPADIMYWLHKTLVPALKNIAMETPEHHPSEKACMWCLDKNTCKARKRQALETAAKLFELYVKLPDDVEMEELSEFLLKLPELKKYIADIELFAYVKLKDGIRIPGWKLVHGRSIRRWKNEKEAKEYYFGNEDLDPDDLVTTKFKSPTQIEKLVGKRNMTDKDRDLVIKPEGKPTLVADTDRRDAIEFQTAEEKFAGFVS